MPRNHRIKVLLNQDEESKVKYRADQLGMKLSSYLRFLALNSTIKVEAEKKK